VSPRSVPDLATKIAKIAPTIRPMPQWRYPASIATAATYAAACPVVCGTDAIRPSSPLTWLESAIA